LNTFEGLTSVKKCRHEGRILPLDPEAVDKRRLPVMIFSFSNREIG